MTPEELRMSLGADAARRDMRMAGLHAPRPRALTAGEPGDHPWCPSPRARTLHSYEGRRCSTVPCRCSAPGSSLPRTL